MTNDIRILHDGGWIHPGGGARVAVELARTFDAPVTVGHSDCPDWWDAQGIDVEIAFQRALHDGWLAKLIDRPALRPAAEMRLGMAFKSLDIDESIVISSGTVAKWWTPRWDQTHIHYCHTPPPRLYAEPKSSVNGWMLQTGVSLIDKHFAGFVDHYISNSDFTAQRVWKHYRRRATVIHPPVRTHRFEYLPPNEDPYFVCIGRLVDMKRARTVAKAIEDVDARLVMLGDGPLREQCEAIDGVSVYPHVSDWALELAVARSVGGVAFAREEHCGITPKEFQAAGKPVIVPDEPNLHNHVEDGKTGVIVEPTVAGAAEGFNRVLETEWDPQAIEQVAETWSVDRFVAELKEYVERVLRRPELERLEATVSEEGVHA